MGVWVPHNGGQRVFLRCACPEVLLEGNRGGGKTDALLMDFGQFCGKGFGPAWTGVLFRQSYPQLEEVIKKSQKWFSMLWPLARYNASGHYWRWATGETLYFRHAARPADYRSYHGHENPWYGWEELTNWANDELYKAVMSTWRSSHPGMPRRYRATTNPYGPGHHWVKARFIDPAPQGTPFIGYDDSLWRMAIHLQREENPALLANDPDYVKRLEAQDGPKRQAWLYGDWNIVAGGMFGDLWDEKLHVIDPFPIPPSWYVNRSFDWGSAKPYSVGWWAESDGSDVRLRDGTRVSTRPGDLFRIAELYGWTGKPDEGTQETAVEVAERIKQVEAKLKLDVRPGPADTSIFNTEDGHCIADRMASVGVTWTQANKASGSRVNGWELLRERLKNVRRHEGPRLFVFSPCRQFIRTVPPLPRDPVDMDDVDTDSEDHVGDETRYQLLDRKYAAAVSQG